MEKELNYDVRKISPKEQEELRKKIVRQMKKYGDTKEVAAICECSQIHVQKTWKKYQIGGIEAILAVKMGRPIGKGCKLSPEQEREIQGLITEKTPADVGLVGYLWGRAEVAELVKRKYGVEMPVRTMGHYLAKWKFTYQRPKKRIIGKMQKR
jgi:transposase